MTEVDGLRSLVIAEELRDQLGIAVSGIRFLGYSSARDFQVCMRGFGNYTTLQSVAGVGLACVGGSFLVSVHFVLRLTCVVTHGSRGERRGIRSPVTGYVMSPRPRRVTKSPT